MLDKLVVVWKLVLINTILELQSLKKYYFFFKRTGNSPKNVLVQLVEKLSYDKKFWKFQ